MCLVASAVTVSAQENHETLVSLVTDRPDNNHRPCRCRRSWYGKKHSDVPAIV